MNTKLNWNEEFDDEDNSIWEASSPWHDDGGTFQWRIKQRLRDNKHEYYDASDEELRDTSFDEETWESLFEAQQYFQKENDDLVEELKLSNLLEDADDEPPTESEVRK